MPIVNHTGQSLKVRTAPFHIKFVVGGDRTYLCSVYTGYAPVAVHSHEDNAIRVEFSPDMSIFDALDADLSGQRPDDMLVERVLRC